MKLVRLDTEYYSCDSIGWNWDYNYYIIDDVDNEKLKELITNETILGYSKDITEEEAEAILKFHFATKL